MAGYQDFKGGTFFETITAAVNDVARHGYDSEARIAFWLKALRRSADRSFGGAEGLTRDMRRKLEAVYHRARSRSKDPKRHKGIPAYVPDRLTPVMRATVNRRVAASVDLIKLNRERAIPQTMQRFSGWATSVPAGGSDDVDIRKTKADISKSIKQLPFEERRVIIDQGHKLASTLDQTIAEEGGAIAVVWHSHYREAGYDFRPAHKARNGKVYALKSGWAVKEGLIDKCDGFYEDAEAFGELPFCRCFGVWYYNLRDIPEEFLTAKGKEYMKKLKEMRK